MVVRYVLFKTMLARCELQVMGAVGGCNERMLMEVTSSARAHSRQLHVCRRRRAASRRHGQAHHAHTARTCLSTECIVYDTSDFMCLAAADSCIAAISLRPSKAWEGGVARRGARESQACGSLANRGKWRRVPGTRRHPAERRAPRACPWAHWAPGHTPWLRLVHCGSMRTMCSPPCPAGLPELPPSPLLWPASSDA